ncbi:MAG: type II secretion system protein [Deltaproteobacteria bacterium]|jgi:general secretion pathway protein I|nr:type II secretion system protein [Deltaproteobacteria bacterium]
MGKGRGRGGFTLVEVVVAMAILGISLVLVIELFSGGLRLGRASEEYTVAAQLARQKIEEIALYKKVEEGIEEGEFDSTYRWQVEVKKIDLLLLANETDYKPPADLYQIQVRIIWKSGSKERTTRIETFRAVKPETDETKTS